MFLSTESLLLQTLNGLSFGALLFLVASGFTLVFGLMRIVNLAHGALFLLGGYAASSRWRRDRQPLLAVVAPGPPSRRSASRRSACCSGASAARSCRRCSSRSASRSSWPTSASRPSAAIRAPIQPPPPVSRRSTWARHVPAYRLFLIGLAVVVGVILYVVQHHSRLGALIRAGVDDREIADAMGIDIDRLFTIMFVVGAGLAGLAGVAARAR